MTVAGRSAAAIFWAGILLVSAKVLWGFWDRDLTIGDTAYYFIQAVRWSQSGQSNIVWSPLYTSYFGFMDGLFPDARASVLLHRTVLVLATTLLAAWSARRFLGPTLAFIVAVWWVALPIHYDTLYEIHLFGSIIAMAAVAVCSFESSWRLPLLVALYGVVTVLLRNENIVCFGILSMYLLFRVYRTSRAGWNSIPLRNLIVRTAILAALGVGLLAYFYHVSHVKGRAQISEVSAYKHRLNMCQVYAFGYQQRHVEWTQSPWTECQPLMRQVFGSGMPSITEMLKSNPGATLEHFKWNLSLSPAGFQVLFFNATSASVNPDYAPVSHGRIYPSVLSALVMAIAVAGAIILHRRRSPFVFAARERDVDFAVLLAANVLTVLLVIMTQRPRPSYLLGFGFICAVAFGLLIQAAWPRWRGLSGRNLAWLAAAAILVVPSYGSLTLSSKDGRLGDLYGMLKGQDAAICIPDSTVAIGEYYHPLRSYLCRSSKPAELSLESIPGMARMGSLEFVAALRERPVQAVILDRIFLQGKTKIANCAELDAALQADGWKRLAFAAHPSGFCDAAYVKANATTKVTH
jgi:hypothetical protein